MGNTTSENVKPQQLYDEKDEFEMIGKPTTVSELDAVVSNISKIVSTPVSSTDVQVSSPTISEHPIDATEEQLNQSNVPSSPPKEIIPLDVFNEEEKKNESPTMFSNVIGIITNPIHGINNFIASITNQTEETPPPIEPNVFVNEPFIIDTPIPPLPPIANVLTEEYPEPVVRIRRNEHLEIKERPSDDDIMEAFMKNYDVYVHYIKRFPSKSTVWQRFLIPIKVNSTNPKEKWKIYYMGKEKTFLEAEERIQICSTFQTIAFMSIIENEPYFDINEYKNFKIDDVSDPHKLHCAQNGFRGIRKTVN